MKKLINALNFICKATLPILVAALISDIALVVGFLLTGYENFAIINTVMAFGFLAIAWALAAGISIFVLDRLPYEVDDDGNIILDEEEEKA